MILLRSRHVELDKWRTLNIGFNRAWFLFFGTIAPGINPSGVLLSLRERIQISGDMPAAASEPERRAVEPYNARIHNKPRVG